MALRKAFLKKVKTQLVDLKSHITRGIRDEIREGREGEKDAGRDTYDVASEARDREISFILSVRDRDKLAAIDAVLDRIDDKTYGICDECEEAIAEERLKAMPFSRLCVQCQLERESEARRVRRPDADRSAFRRLGVADDDDS